MRRMALIMVAVGYVALWCPWAMAAGQRIDDQRKVRHIEAGALSCAEYADAALVQKMRAQKDDTAIARMVRSGKCERSKGVREIFVDGIDGLRGFANNGFVLAKYRVSGETKFAWTEVFSIEEGTEIMEFYLPGVTGAQSSSK
ncbi:MAG: hypothetical protein AB9866_21595 [Syntrophobacteraceae bacterium]